MVRAGKEGEQEKLALELSVITIGWNNLPDLSKLSSKDDLEILYQKYHPGSSRNKISNQVRQIWNFVKRIKKNDFVLIPLKTKNSQILSMGIVESDYEYKQIADDVKHIRHVRWLKEVISYQGILLSVSSLPYSHLIGCRELLFQVPLLKTQNYQA